MFPGASSAAAVVDLGEFPVLLLLIVLQVCTLLTAFRMI
jgi:hypothetical protein